jgi:branched-chain amino acid transport system ATP-binding protein
MSTVLECRNMTAGYGRMLVCRDVNLSIPDGAFVAILGPNGAGKSTLLRGIAGLSQKGGAVLVRDADVSRQGAAARARAGLAFVPESRGNIFPSMSVQENLAIGARRTASARREELHEQVVQLFPILEAYSAKPSGLLSGGEQQMLAIAMALVADPAVILLDEPSQGLAPSVLKDIEKALGSLRSTGITVLLAEQNQRFATSLADELLEIRSGDLSATTSGAVEA